MIQNFENRNEALETINNTLDLLMVGQSNIGQLLFDLRNETIAQGGFSKLASSTGLSRESLYKILSPLGDPQLSTIVEIIRALKFKIKFKINNDKVSILPLINLTLTHPHLSHEFHPVKNGALIPSELFAGSHRKIWWKCYNFIDHEWIASVVHRVHGRNCPMCAGRKLSISNSLLVTHPILAQEWDPVKNLNLTASDVMAVNNQKVWWKCVNNHQWETSVRNRALGQKCIQCNDMRRLLI